MSAPSPTCRAGVISGTRAEAPSQRWPAFAYLLTLAWGASFATHRIVAALGGGA